MKTKRPQDDVTGAFEARSRQFLDNCVDAIPELQVVMGLGAGDDLPLAYRSPDGGDLLFRPIGFPLLAKCLRRAVDHGMSEETFLGRFARMPRALSAPPWRGVLWDGRNMTVAKKNQSCAEMMVLWLVDGDEQNLVSRERLTEILADITQKFPQEVDLPSHVR